MTDHPHHLLAEYVDGSLAPADRPGVESHLRGCPACAEEARLATQARDVLRALPEAEPPAGLGAQAIREARGPGGGLPSWARWGAVAAAVVVAGLVGLSVVGGLGTLEEASPPAEGEPAGPAEEADEAEDRTAAGEPEAGREAPAPTFRVSDDDHDARSLQRLARGLRNDVRDALEAGFAPTAAGFYERFDLGSLPDPALTGLECATNAFSPDRSVVPFLVERSSFEGDPAFVSAFLQGPSPTAEYDRIVIVVADRAGCSLRTFASQRL